MNKTTDDAGGTFVRGPTLTPADALIAWLDKQVLAGEPRLVRLPVILEKGKVGFSTRGARIGASRDAVEIYCNDSKLGVGLADRARSQCRDQDTCAMWLEGYWHGMQDGAYTFAVTKIHARIAPGEVAAASYAEVQGESGN
jgi:hypothetical protein